MSTSSTSIFNGTSRFSSDFQQVISRAVAIASLPINQLTNVKATLSGQATEVGTLQSKFSTLATALSTLNSAIGTSSLGASVSDSGIASVSITDGATPSSFSLEVQSLGSYSNALSSATSTRIADPSTQNLSNSSSFVLTVNGTATRITPSALTLSGLASAINDTAGAQVQASLVNIGSTSVPDYRLSLQSAKLGPVSIQLSDGSTGLLDPGATGALASYKINGLSTAIQSDSRSITLAPGVTAQLVGQSASGVASTVAITRQSFSITNALSTLVNAYNSAADELANNRGKGTGALGGSSIIQELGDRLRQLGSYSAITGQATSLASLGITFDGKGHLALDSSAITSGKTSLTSVINFLGNSKTGGFLKSATDLLTSVNDGTSGLLTGAAKTLADQVTHQQSRIDAAQTRVDDLQTSLQAQLAKADAQVAALEQSYTVLSGILKAQQQNQNS